MLLNWEDGLKQDVLLPRIKGLFKNPFHRENVWLFIFLLLFIFYMRKVQMSLLTMMRTYNNGIV